METGKGLLSNSIISIVGVVVAIAVGMLNLLKNSSVSILLALLIVIICMQVDLFRMLSNLSRRMEAHDALAIIVLGFSRKAQKIFGRKIASIGDVEKAREGVIEALNEALYNASIALMDKIKLSSDRLHQLLEKYKRKELNIGEAKELEKLLEEKEREKEKKGDIAGAIFIGILLSAIAAVIAYLLSKEAA
ncbi:MAG: hypothetical protein ISS94_02555 [Candidatus Syntrophoarchaeum sp.]|nr:hypothetical protein [Candidatus Syntrophoarchaeum sp.]